MRRLLACFISLLAFGGLLAIPGVPWWAAVIGFGAIATLGWHIGKCPHDGPLGLLPATTDLDGAPLPPRWYCDECGRTWPAVFERERTPIRRYTGYDQSKAAVAAKRAEELAERQRELALRRAGLHPSAKRLVKSDPAVVSADVVSIGTRLAR